MIWQVGKGMDWKKILMKRLERLDLARLVQLTALGDGGQTEFHRDHENSMNG